MAPACNESLFGEVLGHIKTVKRCFYTNEAALQQRRNVLHWAAEGHYKAEL